MSDLNQFAISKILGSTIKPVGSVGFGNFAALSTTEEIQDALCASRMSLLEWPSYSSMSMMVHEATPAICCCTPPTVGN